MRYDDENPDWPERPWIMALIGAVSGLILHFLADGVHPDGFPVANQLAISFLVVASLSFVLTIERRRWWWSLAFAVGWGGVVAFVGWFTAGYNRGGEIFEFPFFSGLLAVILAAPLFQTARDEGALKFPYARVHRHVWTDAVIGAAALAFTGITFLLAFLIAGMFHIIGIDFLKDWLTDDTLPPILFGAAAGGAIGLLREKDALAAGLQRLVTVVLSVLAPVLAVALVLFLLSIPFTGLSGLWNSGIPATPLLLAAAGGSFVLVNAVIGDGSEERSVWLRRAALALALCILPLAILASLSMGQRIGQYGWTPERIWGAIACGAAIIFGLIGWWSVIRGRMNFDDRLRPLQVWYALGLCAAAVLLALPILDFGGISAQSQVARLESGKVKAEEFDWTAMAFDFGPKGRERLSEIARTGSARIKALAESALVSGDRYEASRITRAEVSGPDVEASLRILSPNIVLSPGLKLALHDSNCGTAKCALMRLPDGRGLLIIVWEGGQSRTKLLQLDPSADGNTPPGVELETATGPSIVSDISTAKVELRPVTLNQVYVDGKPVDAPFK